MKEVRDKIEYYKKEFKQEVIDEIERETKMRSVNKGAIVPNTQTSSRQ